MSEFECMKECGFHSMVTPRGNQKHNEDLYVPFTELAKALGHGQSERTGKWLPRP